MKKTLLFSFFLVSLLMAHYPVSGQADTTKSLPETIEIKRVASTINFDGIPDEEAWNSATSIQMVMFSPVFGKEPTEQSVVRFCFDDKYLYVSGDLKITEPFRIQSASFKRDFMGMGGDWFGVILDTYNDKENALAFFTTPDGLRWDASVQKDAVLSTPDAMPINISWNAFWDVMTKKSDDGWSTEIRIPLSSIRFQETDGVVKMGLIAWRWIPSKNETDVFPAIPPNWGQVSFLKPSQAAAVFFRGLKPDKPLYIAPYLLGGGSFTNKLNKLETAYEKSTETKFEGGIDIKYGISGNMVLDLTANTDFAQVEADDQQFNLTRFSLYFPEKRMFFLERASIFDFNLGANNTLFYSRRIGLSDNGDPVRIYGGARLIGRLGKWDLGLLNMQTAALYLRDDAGTRYEALPSENFGVLRFRRQVINENSYIGAGFTSRLGMNGNYNIGYGLDGIFRLFGQDYLDVKWAQTYETGVVNSSPLKPARLTFDWTRRSLKGLGYTFGYSYSGLNFNPGIGFEMLDNYSAGRVNILYGWLPGEKSKLFSHNLDLMVRLSSYLEDGSLMTFAQTLGWEFTTKSQWQGILSMVVSREHLRDSLELLPGKVYIPDGTYQFVNFRGMLQTAASKSFFVNVLTETGQYYDGGRFSTRLQPQWNISKHFELGGFYGFDYINFRSRDVSMSNLLLGFKALYMLNTKLSVSAYIQYNTVSKGINSNFKFRYNPREGNDFYLVFNEGRNTSLDRESPRLPVYDARTVLVKYTYTFNL